MDGVPCAKHDWEEALVACDEHEIFKHVASLKFTNDAAERMIYLVA